MAHFYGHSTHLLLQVLDHQNSVKAIVSSQCPPPQYSVGDQKRYLATVINVLAWKDALTQVIANAQVEQLKDGQRGLNLLWKKYASSQDAASSTASSSSSGKNRQHLQPQNAKAATKMLLLVLAHDLILSPSKRLSLSATHPAAQFMAANRARLQAELVRLQIKSGKSRPEDLRSDAVAEEDDDDDGTWYGKSEGKWKRGRWVRVNTRTSTAEQVVAWLRSQGFEECTDGWITSSEQQQQQQQQGSATKRTKGRYAKLYLIPESSTESHPPDLILLPMESTPLLVASDIYKRGHIILQDAASCWPAWVLLSSLQTGQLAHAEPIRVLDATASPGNKTTHLSALLHSLPGNMTDVQLYALERDDRRFSVLVEGLKRARCLQQGGSGSGSAKASSSSSRGLVQPLKMDFLSTDPAEAPWNTITHMLLDPSCSGSGIVGRLDWLTAKVGVNAGAVEEQEENDGGGGGTADAPAETESTRLQKLSDIQVKMIEHAFQYPSLTHLVYSTCSIHSIEDEQVVHRALASTHASGTTVRPDPKFTKSNNKRKRSRKVESRYRWQVVPRARALRGWQWRGITEDGSEATEIEDAMLRAHPYARIKSTSEDNDEAVGGVHPLRTNGFFACAFEKVWLDDGEDDDGAHAATQSLSAPGTTPDAAVAPAAANASADTNAVAPASARARKRARQKANAALKSAATQPEM